MANDAEKPHWSGETDLKLIGGEGLETVTEEQALANAAARSSLYTFEDYVEPGHTVRCLRAGEGT